MKNILCWNPIKLLMAVGLLALTGCETFNDPPDTYLTTVTITNRTPEQVQAAITEVFSSRGFNGGISGADQFTFTRLGSKADQLAYGSYMFKETVNVKVVVTTTTQADGTILVGCNAWLVETSTDAFIDDAHKVRQLRKRPYEELLEAVKAQVAMQQ